MNERTKQLWEESQQWNGSDDGRGGLKIRESVEKFAALVRADEREECAKVADRQNGDDEQDPESCVWSKAARHIAAAIRARGEK
jgi:hypothetical protein